MPVVDQQSPMIFCNDVMVQAFYNNTKSALEREEKLLYTHCNARI